MYLFIYLRYLHEFLRNAAKRGGGGGGEELYLLGSIRRAVTIYILGRIKNAGIEENPISSAQ